MPIFTLRGLCTFSMHPTWQEQKFHRSTILVNFWKKLHARTWVFFRNFSTFFLKLLISKNANIHATGPLHLHCASHMAGTRFRNNLSINHFGEFLDKFACPDLSFLSIIQHFLPQTFNLQKITLRAFAPSLCIPRGRNKVSEKFCRYFSTFFFKLLISKKSRYEAFAPSLRIRRGRNKVFEKFCRYFSTFFHKLKLQNIHATGPLYLHCASLAGTRFLKNFVDLPFWWIFG